MKKHLTNKTLSQSMLSAITLGVFILLALASELDDFMRYNIEYLGNGTYRETDYFEDEATRTTGKRDNYGRWQGPVHIVSSDRYGMIRSTEDVNMLDGKRHGECSTIFGYGIGTLPPVIDSYNMGCKINSSYKGKTEQSGASDISAYQVLCNKYPWFLCSLVSHGFDSVYVESYMDTVETVMGSYIFQPEEFSDYYGDAVDELGETPYDSLITLNSQLTLFQAKEEMKNAELRLAIIDRYISHTNSTFDIVNSTYTGYLQTLIGKGVNKDDFKAFCQDMDNRMTSYGSLNLQDPFFIDSVDARFFRALYSILSTTKSFTTSTDQTMKSIAAYYENNDLYGIQKEIRSFHIQSFSKSTPAEVGQIVMTQMLEEYYVPAEIIRLAVMEAYFIKKGVVRIPTATTVFEGYNSSTSVKLQGYVIENGGATVTARGIAWAASFDPTTSDNKIASGTGTGNFKVTLTGLTQGNTYYARTYATNSAGTSYGNCIKFIASITTDINDINTFPRNFTIYPSPASGTTTFSFQVESSENIMLTIINMKGQLVSQNKLGNLPQGENQIKLDLSAFRNGIYACQLTNNGKVLAKQKLVIAH